MFSLKEMIIKFGMLFLQIDVVTQRGFVPVDERMRVIDSNGKLVCLSFSGANQAIIFI